MSSGLNLNKVSTVGLGVAAIVGILTTVGLVWYAQNQAYTPFDPVGIWLIPVAVFFILGALPSLLLIDYRTITPSLVCACGIWLWFRSEGDPGPGDPIVGFLYFTAPAAIVLSVLFAWAEIRLKTAVLGAIY